MSSFGIDLLPRPEPQTSLLELRLLFQSLDSSERVQAKCFNHSGFPVTTLRLHVMTNRQLVMYKQAYVLPARHLCRQTSCSRKQAIFFDTLIIIGTTGYEGIRLLCTR